MKANILKSMSSKPFIKKASNTLREHTFEDTRAPTYYKQR